MTSSEHLARLRAPPARPRGQILAARASWSPSIDFGAKLDHVDLAPNISTNFDEMPDNRVDDDRNGYVDDSTASTSRLARRQRPERRLGPRHPRRGHRSPPAQNGRGVVGVAPRARLMILKVLDDNGAGRRRRLRGDPLRRRQRRARDQPQPRGPKDDPAARRGRRGRGRNVAHRHVGGQRRPRHRPQAELPGVDRRAEPVAVAGPRRQWAARSSDYSNYGKRTIALAAPGTEILSSTADGGWGMKSGTSMAAPMVTASPR